MNTLPTYADIYTDLKGLAQLKVAARDEPGKQAEALRAVARQFEALFTQMMLKSMRAASPGEDLFGSEQADFYRDMHDQQLAINLSKGQGLGLAEMLVKQLGGQLAATVNSNAPPATPPAPAANTPKRFEAPENFVRDLWPAAQRAGRELGVKPELLIAQAANETGWGKRMIVGRDGQASFNLFGIKADAAWKGARVNVPTVEYEDGVMVRKQDTFRAYDSYEASFRDYVDFLRSNPRYRDALSKVDDPRAFAHALQGAGYATDPAYGRKLISIFQGPTLREALVSLKDSDGGTLTT